MQGPDFFQIRRTFAAYIFTSSHNFCKIPQFHCIKLHKYPAYSITFLKKNLPNNQGFVPATITKKTNFTIFFLALTWQNDSQSSPLTPACSDAVLGVAADELFVLACLSELNLSIIPNRHHQQKHTCTTHQSTLSFFS